MGSKDTTVFWIDLIKRGRIYRSLRVTDHQTHSAAAGEAEKCLAAGGEVRVRDEH